MLLLAFRRLRLGTGGRDLSTSTLCTSISETAAPSLFEASSVQQRFQTGMQTASRGVGYSTCLQPATQPPLQLLGRGRPKALRPHSLTVQGSQWFSRSSPYTQRALGNCPHLLPQTQLRHLTGRNGPIRLPRSLEESTASCAMKPAAPVRQQAPQHRALPRRQKMRLFATAQVAQQQHSAQAYRLPAPGQWRQQQARTPPKQRLEPPTQAPDAALLAPPLPPGNAAVPRAPAGIEAAEPGIIEGVVRTITYRSEKTGYTVFKVKPSTSDGAEKTGLLTATANVAHLMLGQRVRLEGSWTKHHRFGISLKADKVDALQTSEQESMAAVLCGARLPGVGPVTARRMVKHYGGELGSVMDAPDAAHRLAQVKGIGLKSAVRIKAAWDDSRGRREAAGFLQKLGLPHRIAQRIISRHGNGTKEAVEKDPYHAMRNIKGVSLRMVETVARQLELDEQLPSRAAMAMHDMLLEAARQRGHTFLTWAQLQTQSLQYLNASGMPWHGNDLSGIAQSAAARGEMVVELGDIVVPQHDASRGPPPQDAVSVHSSLAAYLSGRIPGTGKKRSDDLVKAFGTGVCAVLDDDAACEQLREKGFAATVATSMKAGWDRNPRNCGPWENPIPGIELPAGSLTAATTRLEKPKTAEVVSPEQWSDSVRCYAPEMHAAEVLVARELARLAAREPLPISGSRNRITGWINRNEMETGMRLSDGQREAVKAASNAPILVLTGGPGCGKTFTTATIVKLWRAMRKSVKLAAPTGRASQRLQETAGVPSSTIHRLLGYRASTNDRSDGGADDDEELEGRYHHCRSTPLQADAVLVDEAAMLDISLGAALLDALPPHCQLLLVGDVDQLPPVGPGTVLAAAIQSGMIPVVDLREIFRQAQESQIVTSAHAVQQGKFPDLMVLPHDAIKATQAFRGPDLSDALWVKPEGSVSGSSLQEHLVQLLYHYILPRGFNLRTDVQVLSPMRKGPAGVEQLNAGLQALLNPPHKHDIPEVTRSAGRGGGPVFRQGDRVIQTVNNYDRDVFNGDPGFVVDADPAKRQITVEFAAPGGEALNGGEKKKVVYTSSGLWELDLAWATTVHKAQGGESPVVVLVLSNYHRPLLTRRLLYTALTRAKKLVVVVGPERAIQTAVSEAEGSVRLSSLQPRLVSQAALLNVTRKEPLRFGNQPPPHPPATEACTEILSSSMAGPQEAEAAGLITPSVALFSVAGMGDPRSRQEDAAPAADPITDGKPQRTGGRHTGGGRGADRQVQGGALTGVLIESEGPIPASLEDEGGQRGQVVQQRRPSAGRRLVQKHETHAALLSAFMSQKKSARA